MTGLWGRAGLVLAGLLALTPGRPAAVTAQAVIPGGQRELVTPDVSPDHWVMDAARRAEALGLLERPLPFRSAISLEAAAEVLEEAREAARGRGAGLEALTDGWQARFLDEYGGLAASGAAERVRLLGVRGRAEVSSSMGRDAPGFGEVGAGRTGAVPLEDQLVAGVAGEAVAAVGRRVGVLLQPAVTSEGVAVERVDLVVGWRNWRFAAGRQPLGLRKSPAAGLVLSGAVPLDRLEVRTARPSVLPGALRLLGPVGAQAFLSRIRDDDRHHREPYLWGGSLSIQPFPRFGVAVHRAAMFGGRGWHEPATVQTFVDMLIGRVANLGFENQIVSVEGRYRLPTEAWAPLTAYLEWGAEDAAGGWWDVPARVIGLESPAIPGLEALSVGAAYTSIAEQCCNNSPWYRHHAFPGNWAADDRPLGHALGGQGAEWLAYGSFDRPDLGLRFDGSLFRRDREGQNLYVPGREESHGAELRGSWWRDRAMEVQAEVMVEAGPDWTAHRLGVGANLFF